MTDRGGEALLANPALAHLDTLDLHHHYLSPAALDDLLAGGALALVPGKLGPGSGGLILWPLFGATNQLLAGLALLGGSLAFFVRMLREPAPEGASGADRRG